MKQPLKVYNYSRAIAKKHSVYAKANWTAPETHADERQHRINKINNIHSKQLQPQQKQPSHSTSKQCNYTKSHRAMKLVCWHLLKPIPTLTKNPRRTKGQICQHSTLPLQMSHLAHDTRWNFSAWNLLNNYPNDGKVGPKCYWCLILEISLCWGWRWPVFQHFSLRP